VRASRAEVAAQAPEEKRALVLEEARRLATGSALAVADAEWPEWLWRPFR